VEWAGAVPLREKYGHKMSAIVSHPALLSSRSIVHSVSFVVGRPTDMPCCEAITMLPVLHTNVVANRANQVVPPVVLIPLD
jgi:hypothetical protein